MKKGLKKIIQAEVIEEEYTSRKKKELGHKDVGQKMYEEEKRST